eukprot:341601-Amphidinium_carterae.1
MSFIHQPQRHLRRSQHAYSMARSWASSCTIHEFPASKVLPKAMPASGLSNSQARQQINSMVDVSGLPSEMAALAT